MKLRSKKTGDVVDVIILDGSLRGIVEYKDGVKRPIGYNSLAELNAEWEDYKPKNPLIKDEKIRKAVRAWAEANMIENDEDVIITKPTFDGAFLDIEYGMLQLSFVCDDDSFCNKQYTIAELCGEE